MKSGIFTFRNAFYIFFLLTVIVSFDRCSDKCQVKNTYRYYTPVYSTPAEIKAAAGIRAARDIKNIGKIYVKGDILFVNEVGEGIHLFDNRDPSQPKALAFLNIPGNLDLAVQGNFLYADSYIDLVVFDITDLEHVKEVNRLPGLFTNFTSYGFGTDPQKGVVTSFKEERMSVLQNECEARIQSWGGIFYDGGIAMPMNAMAQAAPTAVGNSTGVGGAMARFTIVNHFLYGLDGTNLDVVDITSESQPVARTAINVSWDAQTLFPHKNNLFVGGRAGMYIFDLTTPDQPNLISQYDHILSCDPVVVEGDYAYVTLYSGGICHVETNQLEVIDIKDVKTPTLLTVYPMTNPHGLGIDNGTLFICDGDDGLKIFDATDPLSISSHSLAHYDKLNAVDIIPLGHVAIVIGSDGIFQYDYTDVKNIKLLSLIPVPKH